MFFVVAAILLFVTKDLFGKFYGLKFKSKNSGMLLSNTVAMMFGALVLFVVANLRGGPLLPGGTAEVVLSAVFGAVYITVNYVMVAAMACGPMGLTGVICGVGGILGGSIYGIICGDRVTATVVIGAVLMTAAVLLATPIKRHDYSNSRQQVKWFSLSLTAFLLNALLCVIKTEAVSNRGSDSIVFSFWGFLFASLTGLAVTAVYFVRGERFGDYLSGAKRLVPFIGISAIIGISCTLANTAQMLCLSFGTPSIIVYPLTTVSTNLIEAVISVIMLKDQKMSIKIYAAYAVCIIGIILVNIG